MLFEAIDRWRYELIYFILATTTLTYSESFTSGVTATAQCTQWKSFLANLPVENYTLLKIYGSNDTVGQTITDPTIINNIVKALKNSTPYGPVTSNGVSWTVGTCGTGIELAANTTVCQCQNPSYSARPCMGNESYGGIGTNNCNGPSQTISVMLQY
jgi:hypothetical protein